MKLHLPFALRRSLMGCLAFVSSFFSPTVATGSLLAASGWVMFSLAPQAQAGATVLTGKTTKLDGVDYSGVILTLEVDKDGNNNNGSISSSTYTWGDNKFLGTDKVNENGAGGDDALWQNLFCGGNVGTGAGTKGHTLRIVSDRGGPTTFTFDFQDIRLGGLIVELNTNSATRWHTFYMKERNLYWESNGDTILNIKSNMSFNNEAGAKVSTSEFLNNTRWIVDKIDHSDPQHRLTWVGFKITLKGDLSIEGGGEVRVISNGLEGASTMTVDGGKTVTVDGGTSLKFMATDGGATEGGFVLGNNANVNINNGTISLAELTGPTTGAGRISGTTGWQFDDNAKITGNIAAAADTTLTLGSSLTFSNAKLAAADKSTFLLTSPGTLSLKGDGTFNGGTIKTDGVVSVDGTLTVAQGTWESTNSLDLHSGSVTLTGTSTLKVSGKLNFGGATLKVDGGRATIFLADPITISGAGELGTGLIEASENGSITLADGARLAISTDGAKNLNSSGITLNAGSTLVVKNLSNWSNVGNIQGPGVLALDIGGFNQGNLSTNTFFNSFATGNGAVGALFAGRVEAPVHVVNNSFLQVGFHNSNLGNSNIWDTQVAVFNKIPYLKIEDGSALAFRPGKDDSIGSNAQTIVVEGSGQVVTGTFGPYYGALLFSPDTTSSPRTTRLDSNLVLAGDATVYVANPVANPDPGGRTAENHHKAVLGNTEESGSLTSGGNTLTKVGGGSLILDHYFTTSDGDTGDVEVVEGSVALQYADAAALAGYRVRVGEGAALILNAQAENDGGYVLQGLGSVGSASVGSLELSADGGDIPVLVFRNNDTTPTNANTFTGDIVTNGQEFQMRMESGYQRLGGSLDGTLNLDLVGGLMDLTGLDEAREENALLQVTVSSAAARVDGLVLRGEDVLDVSDEAASFNFTMKGGKLLNATNYTGQVTLDDSDTPGVCEFNLQGLSTKARVNVRALHADATSASMVSTDALSLTLTGKNYLTLGTYLQEGQAGFGTAGFFNMESTTGSLVLDKGATVMVSVVDVIDAIAATGDEGALFRISNHSIEGLEGALSFGAELSLFNMAAELADETGCLRFVRLTPTLDHIYQSTQDNVDNSSTWAAGDDVYASMDNFAAVYVDRYTEIDLRGAEMNEHTEGLVLKNLMGKSGSNLTVQGDGSGLSKITICNNMSDEYLRQLADELQVDIRNTLTFGGNISLTNTDLQVRHLEADSTTVVLGSLSLAGDATLEMTQGRLELKSAAGNELGNGGVSFGGHNAQLALVGGVSALGGHISLAEVDTDTLTYEEQLSLTGGAQLDLRAGSSVDAGITIGSASETDYGQLNIHGGSSMESGAQLRNLVLHLAAGAELSVVPEAAGAEAAGGIMRAAVPAMPGATEWKLLGMTGSGALSSAEGAAPVEILLTPAGENRTFSGDLSKFAGRIQVQSSGYRQTFSGVKGGKQWSLVNTAGGRVELNLMGSRQLNTLEMQSLTLQGGSDTTILLDMMRVNAAAGTGLQLGTLQADSTAGVTVGHHLGSVRLTGDATGRVLVCFGKADNAATGELEGWEITGVRNMKDKEYRAYVEDGYAYAEIFVDSTNKWAEHADDDNAQAGAGMLWQVEDTGAVGGDLAALDNAVSALLSGDNWKTPGNVDKANKILAAAAGASTAVLGQAFAGDLERQMRTIRNRTTSMGYSELDTPQSGEMPRWNVWLNAEGNYAKLAADGNLPGYKMSGWGGTVGLNVDTDEETTLGFALTAMYNDIDSDGPDALKGNLDTYYLSAFARLSSGAWLHTFVGSFGLAQVDADRTVDYGTGSYTTNSSTQGYAIGLMYEVGYGMALNQYGTVCVQPVVNVAWRYTSLNAYTEDGSTAALQVEGQTYSTVTLGAGARVQSMMGTHVFNRSGLLEARALIKLDVGDRRGSASTAFRHAPEGRGSVKSAERGAVGLELGTGFAVPLGGESGQELFVDVSAELRSQATELNATVGWKMSF